MIYADKLKGLCLGEDTRWVITGLSNFEQFFRHLEGLLPGEPAVIYLEGVSISPDVRKFFEEHSIPPWHVVYPGTIWPKPSIFHLPASPKVLEGLTLLASSHMRPEIADHCHVYTKDGMILQWYDACCSDCPLGAGPTIPEDRVKMFCDLAGARYVAYTNR